MFEKGSLFDGITEVAVAICVYDTYDKNKGIRADDINYIVMYDTENRYIKIEDIQYIDMTQHCYIARDLNRYPVILDGKVITKERPTLVPDLHRGYMIVDHAGTDITPRIGSKEFKSMVDKSTNAKTILGDIVLLPELYSFKNIVEGEVLDAYRSGSMRYCIISMSDCLNARAWAALNSTGMQVYDFERNKIISFRELTDILGIRRFSAFLNTADSTYAEYYWFTGSECNELTQEDIYITNSSKVYPLHKMCIESTLMSYMEHTIVGQKRVDTEEDACDTVYIVAEKDSGEKQYRCTKEYSLSEIARMTVLSGSSIFNGKVILRDSNSSYNIDILALTGYYRHEIKKELINTEPTEQMKTAENINRKLKMLGCSEQYKTIADGRTWVIAEKNTKIVLQKGLKLVGIHTEERVCLELLEFKEGSDISMMACINEISSIYKVKIHSCDMLDKVKKLSERVNIYIISVPCSISMNEFRDIKRADCIFIEIRGSKGEGILRKLGELVEDGGEEGTFIYKNRKCN